MISMSGFFRHVRSERASGGRPRILRGSVGPASRLGRAWIRGDRQSLVSRRCGTSLAAPLNREAILVSAESSAASVRAGFSAMGIGGVLLAVFFTMGMLVGGDENDPAGRAQSTASIADVIGNAVYVLSLIGLLLGLVALLAFLRSAPQWGWRVASLVFGFSSIACVLVGIGAAGPGAETVASLYAPGQNAIANALGQMSGGTFGPYILPYYLAGAVLGLLCAIFAAVALWNAVVPHWLAVLFAAGFALSMGSAPLVTQIGGVLLAIASFTLARRAASANAGQ